MFEIKPIPPSPTPDEERLRSELGESAAMHAAVVEAALDCIVTVGADGLIREWNPAATETFGYSREQAIGAPMADLLIPEHLRPRHLAGFGQLVETGDAPILGRRIEVEGMRADGAAFPCELTLARISTEPLLFTAFARDISLSRARENQLLDLARENELILSSAGDGILRLDGDGRVAYANPAAAEMLGCTPSDLVGEIATAQLHHSAEDGTPLDGAETPMGQALRYGDVRHVTSEVFWRADGAALPVDYTMAPLRRDGEIAGAVCVFADVTEERRRTSELRERLDWQGRLSRAIEEDRLLAYAQPIVDLATGAPKLEEMLVRVREREGDRIIAAGEFLPHAERLGLTDMIDEWMVERALEQVAAGRRVAVNLSALTVQNELLMAAIVERISAAGTPSGALAIEITETAAIEDVAGTGRLIDRLHEVGCPLAIDDFGTGFGSITYLRDLRAEYVKIDMAFVRGAADSDSDRKIIAGIVGLAHSLGKRTIAEGIETPKVARACRELGVDLGQGYLFGRPAPTADPPAAG